MKAKTLLLRACAIILIVTMPWFLALTALFPLISSPFLRLQYARPDIPPSTRFAPQERQRLAEAAAHYLVSGEGIDYLANLTDLQGSPFFNDRELDHMVDVKVLLRRAVALDVVLGLLVVTSLGILISQRETRDRTPSYLIVASLVAPVLSIAALVAVTLQFRWFFVEFHHLFFVGETWLFPRSDTLIQLFPEMFWFAAFESWILLLMAISAAIGVGAYVWHRKRRTAVVSP